DHGQGLHLFPELQDHLLRIAMGKWLPLLSIMALSLSVSAGQGRYLTWLDDQGRIHNTFIETRSGQVHRGVAPRRGGEGWSATLGGSETKRRYFTWVDASGALQKIGRAHV